MASCKDSIHDLKVVVKFLIYKSLNIEPWRQWNMSHAIKNIGSSATSNGNIIIWSGEDSAVPYIKYSQILQEFLSVKNVNWKTNFGIPEDGEKFYCLNSQTLENNSS